LERKLAALVKLRARISGFAVNTYDILNCRTEFNKLNAEHIAAELAKGHTIPNLDEVIQTFCADVANMSEIPKSPLAYLRAYINRARKDNAENPTTVATITPMDNIGSLD